MNDMFRITTTETGMIGDRKLTVQDNRIVSAVELYEFLENVHASKYDKIEITKL